MPRRSQSGPPSRIEKPKPQNAAPAIQPTSVLVKANSCSKSPMISPRIANDIAVATSAVQLAMNNRRGVVAVSGPLTRRNLAWAPQPAGGNLTNLAVASDQHETHLWLFFAPSFSSSASASG